MVAAAFVLLAAVPPPNVCPRDPQTKRITYQAVVAVEGVAVPELYSRAKAWVATTFRSAKAVIDLDDKDAGRLVAKGVAEVPFGLGSPVNVRFTLTVEARDGRFRYTLTDLEQLPATSAATVAPIEGQFPNPFFGRKFWERLDGQCAALIASLTRAMQQPAAAEKW